MYPIKSLEPHTAGSTKQKRKRRRKQLTQIRRQTLVRGDQHGVSRSVELRPARSTEYLQYIQDGQVHETTALRVIQLRTCEDVGKNERRGELKLNGMHKCWGVSRMFGERKVAQSQ